MIQRTIKNRIRYSKYKLLLMLIGVLSAHSWTQAQNSPPTNEVMIDIDTTASWEKIKKEKTNLALKTNPVRCYLNSQSGFGNRNNPADKPQHSRQL